MFSQALRGSYVARDQTFSYEIPIAIHGDQLRATFEAGDGAVEIDRVGVDCSLPGRGDPIWRPLLFGGGDQAGVSRHHRVRTVPLDLSCDSRVRIRFHANGSLAASSFDRFPSGPFHRGVGLVGIEMRATPQRVFAVIGDSLSEGYVRGEDDFAESWPVVAQASLRTPVVSIAWSGDSVRDALDHLPQLEDLAGVTDCVTLIGTNDLGRTPPEEIERELGSLADRLSTRCRVWIGTLPPKDRTPWGDYAEVVAARRAVNAWIRRGGWKVVSFDAAVADETNPDRLRDGFSADGVHLTPAGQRALAEAFVQAVHG